MKHPGEGSLDELEEKLTKLYGEPNRNKGNIYLCYEKGKTHINVYKKRGKDSFCILVQPDDVKIDAEIKKLISTESYIDDVGNRVFIVHGHDVVARQELENILYKWKLEPYVMADDADNSSTLIEKLENETRKSKFAIVLLTPDDMGYAQNSGEATIQPRARQNVILEMGMLMGILGRNRVAILRKSDTEIPSDAQGILYLPFTKTVDEVKEKLKKNIEQAGLKIK